MIQQYDQLAVLAANNEQVREKLIREQEGTILRTAFSVCHRFITKSDDEWSIALCAFSRAVDIYSYNKGSFLPFAQMLIKRSLIDYYRAQKYALREVPVSPLVMEGNGEPEEDTEGVYQTLMQESRKEMAGQDLQEEVRMINEMLQPYGFCFYDLTACSPQQEKTRKQCAAAIRYMLAHRELLHIMKQKHKLPLKKLVESTGISKKILDRYRKYVIMAVLVLSGDYPLIAEYLKFVYEEAAE